MRPIIEFCEPCRERKGKQVIAFKVVNGTPMCRSCFGGETQRPVKSEHPPQKQEPKIKDKETLASLYELRSKLQDNRDNLAFELEETDSDILAVKRVLELLAGEVKG